MSSPAHTTTSEDAAGTLAIISLGSNLGLRQGNQFVSPESILRQALHALQNLSASPLIVSSLYQTSPLDSPAGAPDYLNAIALLRASPRIEALDLLADLQALEAHFGRTRQGVPNQPRSLDLDLIAFGDLRCNEPMLVLPHPRAHERRFVMAPLAEVAPNLKLAGQDFTATELAERLARKPAIGQVVQRLPVELS